MYAVIHDSASVDGLCWLPGMAPLVGPAWATSFVRMSWAMSSFALPALAPSTWADVNCASMFHPAHALRQSVQSFGSSGTDSSTQPPSIGAYSLTHAVSSVGFSFMYD